MFIFDWRDWRKKMYGFFPSLILAWFPEVIYFTLFLIFTKRYNYNRLKLFSCLLIGYVFLKICFPKNIYFQISYTLLVPIILKILYKNKFHISDIFVFVYASLILIFITIMTYPFALLFNNYVLAFILNRIVMFSILFIIKNNLNKVYVWIISQWNRNYEKPNKIKSITIRQTCVISLNIMIFMLYLSVQILINS